MSLNVFIQDLLQQNYHIGDVIAVQPIKAGDTNRSFFAITQNEDELNKYYVRQYNTAEQERDIIYEHAFERYYAERVNGAMQTMIPIENRKGKTWLTAEYDCQENFYAVFNTIKGLEPYSWEYNMMPPEALDACAKICAQFHTWANGFCGPKGSGRREPALEELFHIWREDLVEAEGKKRANPKLFKRFTDYFDREIPYLLETIDFCERELKLHSINLKRCICHKDLHPGNVMFNAQNQITAVFDLDWVNEDYRLYDIGWMGYQATASWETETWGEVPIEKIGRFISVYDNTICSMKSPIGALTEEEREFLPVMMIIGAVKVILDFTVYENHEHEVHRMFVNTWRFMSSVHYMREHLDEIRKAAGEGLKTKGY